MCSIPCLDVYLVYVRVDNSLRFQICRTGSSMFQEVFLSWKFFIANVTILFFDLLMTFFVRFHCSPCCKKCFTFITFIYHSIPLWTLLICIFKIELEPKHFSQVEQNTSFLLLQVWSLNLSSFWKYSLPFPQ